MSTNKAVALIKKKRKIDSFKLSNLLKFKSLYIMMIPGLLFFLVYHYLPMIGIVIAFEKYSPVKGLAGFFTSEWIGLANFKKFFSSVYFTRIFGNTVAMSGLRIIFGFPAPIIFALLLNEVRNTRYKKLAQSISYLPHFLSWVIVASMMYIILSPSFGVINDILKRMGLDTVYFLGRSDMFRPIIVISYIWKNAGWSSIIYLATITGIDESLYEAAEIDGASRFQKMWYITIQGMKEIISIMLILAIGNILNSDFEQILLLYSPQVYRVADVIDTYVYREGLVKANFSFATAVSLTKSVIAIVLITITNKLANRFQTGGLW